MKKNTSFILILSAALLILLAALAIWLRCSPDLTASRTISPAECEAESVLQTLKARTENHPDTAEASSESESDAAPPEAAEAVRIWVGDSRTLGMERALGDDTSDRFIGAAGEGYDWFASDGLPQLQRVLEQFPSAPVIFNLGVNDYDNLSRYLELYQTLIDAYPGTSFYFLSVNPVDPARCQNITNEEISDFNAHLKLLAADRYIDSYTWMLANDVQTKDGIHYSEEDYRALYKYVITQL